MNNQPGVRDSDAVDLLTAWLLVLTFVTVGLWNTIMILAGLTVGCAILFTVRVFVRIRRELKAKGYVETWRVK